MGGRFMQIILSVLQFLVLLGILVLLLGLILFYPICYKMEGTFENENNAKVNVSWLFHLVRAKLIYEDDLIFAKVGIFWKTIPFSYEFYKSQKNSHVENDFSNEIDESNENNTVETKNKVKRKETDGISSRIGEESSEQSENEFDLEVEDLNLDEETDLSENDFNFRNNSEQQVEIDGLNLMKNIQGDTQPEIQDFNLDDEVSETIFDNDIDTKTESELYKNKSERKSTSKSKRKSNRRKKCKKQKPSILGKIKGMISKIKGTINKGKEIWSELKAILTDKRNQSAVSHVKDEIFSLLKIFLPKSSEVDIIFSLGSPDITGKVLGLYFIFPFVYQNEWNVRPDFEAEEVYVKGTFSAKGRIYLYKIVGMVLRILFDKNCRRLYKTGKKFMNKIDVGGDSSG